MLPSGGSAAEGSKWKRFDIRLLFPALVGEKSQVRAAPTANAFLVYPETYPRVRSGQFESRQQWPADLLPAIRVPSEDTGFVLVTWHAGGSTPIRLTVESEDRHAVTR
jgi:hypothetical protein